MRWWLLVWGTLLLSGLVGCLLLAQRTIQWHFAPLGALEISSPGGLLVRNLACVLVKPGWQGSYADQLNSSTAKIVAVDNRQWQGHLHGDGAVVAFWQQATLKGNELLLSYQLHAKTTFVVETAMLRCYLPVEGNAGKARWWALTETHQLLEGTFPATLPQPYHLLSRNDVTTLMWQLPSGWALQFDFNGGFVGLNLQDNRQFGANDFELQLHLKHGRWQEGETVRAQLRLAVLSPEEAQSWVQQAKQAAERERTILLTKRAPLKLKSIRPNAKQLRRYETLEVGVDLDAAYDNPFDPDQIAVDAEIVSPSGKRMTLPGFFTQEFERVKEDGRAERLRKVGDPYFAVRFTPTETGTYRYRIVVTGHDETGKKGQVASDWFQLRVLPNPKHKGFVRQVKFYHLQFDDGTPFVPVGLNVCWSGNNLSAYERWFAAMRQNGANFARIWLVRWNMGLEWTPGDGSGLYLGLGKYALDNAWRIDQLLRIAEQNGVYLMLCLGYHGELADQRLYFGEQAWHLSPYNRKNGGPCDKPADFWVNPEAKRFYKQRLRYIVARYAHSPHVLAFEFWNEVFAPAPWVQEMAQFVRSIDIYRHLLTTTYGDEAVWRLPEMDFVQDHWYGEGGQPDSTPAVVTLHRRRLAQFRKPYLLGEFGIDWRSSDVVYDPKGNALHWRNGMWASLMAGGMGTACVWYWDNYIDRLNLWHHFRPVAEFVQLVGKDWLQDWKPLQHTPPMLTEPPVPPYGDFVFAPTLSWQRPTGDTFVLHRDGRIESDGETSLFLFSPSKPDLYRPPKFVVDFPEDGQLLLRVDTVSSGALLIVRLNGKEIWRQPLPEGAERKDEQGRVYREGSYQRRQWVEQWRKWDYIYERTFAVPIPKGKHIVEVDNLGADWCTVPEYRFTPYRDRRFAEVNLVGIQTERMALVWVQNQASNFQTLRAGKSIPPLRNLRFAINGLRDGRYRITLWDTWKGGVVREWQTVCRNGTLTIDLEQLEKDFALIVRP